MASTPRALIPLIAAACSAPEAPVRRAAQPAGVPLAAAAPASSRSTAPAPAAQVFAPADPGFAFADPDRRAKLVAALPAIDGAVAEEMKRQSLPGFAIGIVIDGKLEYEKGFGIADLETKAKPDADTVYRVGSITKSFAGLALLAARDAGQLGVDDPLARWIPEAGGLVYPSRDARPITLRQLASHTSGLPRVGSYDGDHGPTEELIAKSLPGFPLEYAPGTGWVYSNLGFSLLGIAIGRAGGASFDDVVTKRILVPLGMTSSYWSPDRIPPGRLATAYESTPSGPKPTRPADRGAGSARGGLFSTVRDMARYVAFQLSAYPPRDEPDEGPIRRATLREAHSTGTQMESSAELAPATKPGDYLVSYSASTYGFGWVKEQSCDFDDLIHHGGAIDSYRAMVAFLPTRGAGVVVMTNFENGDPDAIARRALAELVRTGALAQRVARPAPEFAATMQKLLAVQNQWDEAAYKAMLDPGRRPLIAEEQVELAGYRSLHGACKSFVPVEVASPTSVRFKVECERGALELQVGISPKSGLITGFVGTSRDVAMPPALRKQVDAIAGLIGRWDDGAHQRLLARTKRSRPDAKKYFDELRAAHGACRVKGAVHQGVDWQMELQCDRGEAVLRLALRAGDPVALEDYRVVAAGRGCPRR
jgi:CubicO group peptidase (beta-lactamase class C family)